MDELSKEIIEKLKKEMTKRLENNYDNLKEIIGKEFYKTFTDEEVKKYEITFDYDLTYDHSGELNEIGRFSIDDYKFLNDFLEEYTRNWTASFQSGCGKHWDTYEDEFYRMIQDFTYNIMKEVVQEILPDVETQDILMDYYDDFYEPEIVDIELDYTKKLYEINIVELYEIGKGKEIPQINV